VTRSHAMTRLDPRLALTLLLTAVLLALAVSPAEALRTEKREKVRRQIREVKAWQLSRELDLDEEQARAFMPAHGDYEDRAEELELKREAIEAELDSLLADGGGARDERRMMLSLEKLKRVDLEMDANRQEFDRKMRRILRPQQQVRYELFERKFDAELRRMIRDAREEPRERPRAWRDSSRSESGKSESDRRESRETQKKTTGDSSKKTKKKDRSSDSKKSDKKDSSEERSSKSR